MFDSKSPVMKIVGYILIAFFALIIIISFGMPDFISRIGGDRSIVAKVNGETVHALDFLRYRDSRFRHLRDRNMNDYILNNYIAEVLLQQTARKSGVTVSETSVIRTIREIPEFSDPSTGRFDYDRFTLAMHQNQMNETEFRRILTRDLVRDRYTWLMGLGITVDDREVRDREFMAKSQVKVRYAVISNYELKKKHAAQIVVSDAEIDQALKNQKEVKDPRTDRERIRLALEEEKLKAVKKNLQDTINLLASQGKSFAEAQALLGGTVAETAPFAIGEQVRPEAKDAQPIPELTESPQFRAGCLSLAPGQTSPLLVTANSLYIYTPVTMKYPQVEPEAAALKDMRRGIEYQRTSGLSQNLLKAMSEKAKIIKNLKTD